MSWLFQNQSDKLKHNKHVLRLTQKLASVPVSTFMGIKFTKPCIAVSVIGMLSLKELWYSGMRQCFLFMVSKISSLARVVPGIYGLSFAKYESKLGCAFLY